MSKLKKLLYHRSISENVKIHYTHTQYKEMNHRMSTSYETTKTATNSKEKMSHRGTECIFQGY